MKYHLTRPCHIRDIGIGVPWIQGKGHGNGLTMRIILLRLVRRQSRPLYEMSRLDRDLVLR